MGSKGKQKSNPENLEKGKWNTQNKHQAAASVYYFLQHKTFDLFFRVEFLI